MSNNEGLIKNNEKNESKEKLMTRIKEENIMVWSGILLGLIIIIIIYIGCNILFIYLKSPTFAFLIFNLTLAPITIVFIFIPIGIHVQFDYENKIMTINKYCSLPYLLKLCTKKEISFSEINHFDIQKFILLTKRYFSIGYYDNSNQFQSLIIGQDISCNCHCEYSKKIDNIPKILNDLLKEENV